MSIIPVLLILPFFLVLLGSLWQRGSRALKQAARWHARADLVEREAEENLRLLRAGGIELREQGLSLLGQSELGPKQDALEWAAIAARLLSMADDMQDHAPAASATRVLERELIALEPLVAQCVAAVAASLRPSVRLWRLSAELAALELFGDRRALSQVILRVLSNAARATRHQDWIEIGVRHTASGVVLTVEDEGSGLLGPSSSHAGDRRGFGIGLAVAKSLVQAHGGGLNVHSVPGVGARVEIALPQFAEALTM